MELVCVGIGYAVMRCQGLYEAKVTLVPALPVPPEDEGQQVCVELRRSGCGSSEGLLTVVAAAHCLKK